MVSALPSKQAFQRHFVQSSSLLSNALLRNKRYPLEQAPLPSLFLNFSSASRPPKKLPACRRLLFPLLHACNKGNRRCLHAGNQKSYGLGQNRWKFRPVVPSPQIKDDKKQPRSQGSLLLGRILVFARLDSGKRGFQSISQLINQSISQSINQSIKQTLTK